MNKRNKRHERHRRGERDAPGERPVWLVLAVTGFVCALVIVSVYELTRSSIERHSIERLRNAIRQVLPGAVDVVSYRRSPTDEFEREDTVGAGARVVHAGYDNDGALIGFAIRARGAGYQDVIEVMYGVNPWRHQIVGLAVLESRETPGLGDRIRTDPGFLAAFAGLDAAPAATGGRLVREISLARRGHARVAGQVDGITGATVSSAAVVRMINESAASWLPALHSNLKRFEE